jgi:crotonobetainyl-CoA:carnitine CoA-transferase CaiB-like acyl-CoA transferase
MNGILDGIKVIDLSRLLPGPLCTQTLGDLGADVLKVEETAGGDYSRYMPPMGKVDSGNFLSINRNKKSIKLNLRAPEGKAILWRLLEDADVLIEQFRPGVLDKLGFGYEVLKEKNPRLIVCSISGYGQNGPWSQKAGHDINYLSQTGILDLLGSADAAPIVPGIQIADVGGGTLWSTIGILAALFAREKTGKGQYVDVSMSDTVLASFMTALAGCYGMDKKVPQRGGELLGGGFAWYFVYETKDNRYISVGMLEEKFWQSFCKTIDRLDYIPIQMGPPEVQDQMKSELRAMFLTKTADEWMELLGPIDACISKVNTLEEAMADEHLQYRGMFVESEHPVEGKFLSIGFPVQFSEQPYSIRIPPPAFGQHTDEILTSLGYSKDEIDTYREAGVI